MFFLFFSIDGCFLFSVILFSVYEGWKINFNDLIGSISFQIRDREYSWSGVGESNHILICRSYRKLVGPYFN